MKSVYQFREGSHLSGDAQAVGERLEKIRATRAGLTPDAVLEDARDTASVLHPFFEWDDTKAAHSYRIAQAGHVIRCVTVAIEEAQPSGGDAHATSATARGASVTVRAFMPVQRQDGDRIYESTALALSDADYRRQVLERAHSELNAVSRKYRELEELSRVIVELDRVGEILKGGLPVNG